jgi:peptidyl-prolyl cis-trans isomerase D
VSDLVRSPYGFHIIKVEEKHDAREKPLEEVKGEIEDSLKREKARDVAFQKARDFADLAYANMDVGKTAETQGLRVNNVDKWVSAKDTLPGLLNSSAKVTGALFALSEKGVSQVIETTEGFVIGQVTGVQPPQVQPFDMVKERVEKEYREDMARKLAQEKATELLQAARQAKSLEQAAAEKKLEVKKTDWFSRRVPDKQLRLRGDSLNQIFQLGETRLFPEAPLTDVANNAIVCQVLGKKSSDEDIEKEKPALLKRILTQKQNGVWRSWLEEQRQRAKVEQFKKL